MHLSTGPCDVVDRLLRGTRGHRDPYLDIEWPPTLPAGGWCMPPELLSLHGTPVFDALDDVSRRELSRLELIHFFSINIHGEARLIAGLDARLDARLPAPVAAYLARFSAEEEKHRACFIEFCERYGKGACADRGIAFDADWSPDETGFVFFARVLVFEELVARYNGVMARDRRVIPVVRQINRAHHVEEAGHIAFGRAWLRELAVPFHQGGACAIPGRVIEHLAAWRTSLWRDLFSPDVYRDAGLPDPYQVRNLALAHPSALARCQRLFAGTEGFLAGIGCTLPEVA